MSENPYQVLGVEVPLMLGRERLFGQLCRQLTKATPDHVCVVGPTKFGKSVLLRHLASNVPGDRYVASVYWDFRRGPPKNDDQFRRGFADKVRAALRPVRAELAGWLDDLEDSPFDLLDAVFDELDIEDVCLLAILDGFDHVMKGSGITRNLWDQMRALAQKKSVRLVTGSRARLRELCKDEESRTSDFWEIFYVTPLRLGGFRDDDWNGFLEPFASKNIEVEPSARTALVNWTGGVPLLSAALADRLIAGRRKGDVLSKDDVDIVANGLDIPDVLGALWGDCPIELQSLLTELSGGRVLGKSEIPERQRSELVFRGFACESRDGLRSSCQLMAEYAGGRKEEVAYLKRLFGLPERFNNNIQGMLELRLNGIRNRADPKLVGFVEKAIRDLRPDPDTASMWMRSVADAALDLIWKAELAGDGPLPDDWKSLYEEGRAPDRLPPSRGPQCHLLRLVTGTERNRRITRFVTKPTCLLVDHIQSIGNFGWHREGQEVSLPTAASFCLSAIELCERLSEELPR